MDGTKTASDLSHIKEDLQAAKSLLLKDIDAGIFCLNCMHNTVPAFFAAGCCRLLQRRKSFVYRLLD
jgi:hypothetical protein